MCHLRSDRSLATGLWRRGTAWLLTSKTLGDLKETLAFLSVFIDIVLPNTPDPKPFKGEMWIQTLELKGPQIIHTK